MAKGLVVNAVAGTERYTEVFTRDHIRIGNNDDCDLQLTASGASGGPLPDFIIEISRLNGIYRISHISAGWDWTHNQSPLQFDAPLHDGDQIALPAAGISLQFFPVGGLPAVLPALRQHSGHVVPQTDAQLQAENRHDEAKVFLREFTGELFREISPLTKILSIIFVCVAGFGIFYLGYSFSNELRGSRAIAEKSQEEITALKGEITALTGQMQGITTKTEVLSSSASLTYKVRNDYGNGVCLIYGLYYYADAKTGKALRYPPVTQPGMGEEVPMEGEQVRPYVTDGNGPVAEFETIGTGFHVGNGFILTNRHVVQPWREDRQIQQLKSIGATARMKKLIVYFPDRPQPLMLTFRQAAAQEDVAVCKIENLPDDIPVLPLDSDGEAVAVGRIVALMGYPNGPNRLLAKLEEPEQQALQKRCGGTQGSLVGCLSEKNLIKPLTTQGTITDKDVKRVVYDARTAEGGSGSPLFGQSGRVIGINFGVFVENEASNFAVPIRYGINLLQRLGWSDKPAEANANVAGEAGPGNANTNRNTTATANIPR